MQVHQTPTLLLTRPQAASERFATGLTGANVVIAPLMEIVGTGAEVDLQGIRGLIVTSPHAVHFTPASCLPAFCVGPRTAEVAHAAGMQAEVLGPDANGLVEQLTARRPGGRLLHVHGTHQRGDIAARLQEVGLDVDAVAAYDQRALAPDDAFREALTRPNLIVPLFSPRSAALFADAAPILRRDARIVALSQAVADALPQALQAQTSVAVAPNGAEMDAALKPFGLLRNSP